MEESVMAGRPGKEDGEERAPGGGPAGEKPCGGLDGAEKSSGGLDAVKKFSGGSLDLAEAVRSEFGLDRTDIRTYSPLTLAFLGDSVYDLLVKTMVVERANRAANRLHKLSSGLVKAGTQAEIAEALMDTLTGEEQEILRRGRNAKSYSTAKNASVGDYRKATGLEALFGYLYLQGRLERAAELLREGLRLTGMSD